jgi:hypothetical protein
VSDDLVQSVNQKNCERRRFTISELPCEFPQISSIVLYEIRQSQVLPRRLPKMLTGAHKMQGMVSASTFLEQYHKGGDEFLSHIV